MGTKKVKTDTSPGRKEVTLQVCVFDVRIRLVTSGFFRLGIYREREMKKVHKGQRLTIMDHEPTTIIINKQRQKHHDRVRKTGISNKYPII
jgi:hypothetical protein